MERALQRLARQLNQYDTASLTTLWENYAKQTSRFEPTKRWEEAALAFCMIQAVHWKNQLFNYGMRQSSKQLHEGETEAKNKLLNKLKLIVDTMPKASSTISPDTEAGNAGQTNLVNLADVMGINPRTGDQSAKSVQSNEAKGKSVGGVQQKKRCKVLFFHARHTNKS
jgi:hypothetical protein